MVLPWQLVLKRSGEPKPAKSARKDTSTSFKRTLPCCLTSPLAVYAKTFSSSAIRDRFSKSAFWPKDYMDWYAPLHAGARPKTTGPVLSSYFIIFFFLRTQIARNKTSGYMVTKYPPVTPLRANSTTVRRPLDKMKPKDWLRQFLPVFYVRTQVATLNKTSGYHGYKETLQWSHFEPTVQRLGRPLDKLRPKDWFRHLSTSTCEERVKRL